MGEFELCGMKAAFGEMMGTAIMRQHEPQRIVTTMKLNSYRCSDMFNVKFLYTWMDRIDSDRRLCIFVRLSVHSV